MKVFYVSVYVCTHACMLYTCILSCIYNAPSDTHSNLAGQGGKVEAMNLHAIIKNKVVFLYNNIIKVIKQISKKIK